MLRKQDDIDPRVPGRIHRNEFRRFWANELQAADMLLALLEEGYKLPFASIPPKSSLPNNFSARQHNNFDFVCKAIANHLKVGAIQEVDWTPHLMMPLQVVAPNGRKKRLITDPSRQLNPFLNVLPVRLDNLQRIVGSFEQDSWFGVMDLSSGYYHIQIHKPHQNYLGFAWTGWVENVRKAKGPTQKEEYLGLMLHTPSLTIHVPQEKKNLIITLCRNLANRTVWHVKEVAQIYGKLLANLLATGPQLLLLCRNGLKTLAAAESWSSNICIKHLHEELLYLADTFSILDGYPMEHDNDKVATSVMQTASDASGEAVAVVQIVCQQGVTHSSHEGRCGFKMCLQSFSSLEKTYSSTWRELYGLLVLLKNRGLYLTNKSIIHWTDSKNVERVMRKGSHTTALQQLAMEIYMKARSLHIVIQVIWRPRSDPRIQLADDFSRAVDMDDFGIDDRSFNYIQHLAARSFDFDLFALDDNYRVPRFASILASNKALFRDAFTHPWADLGFCYAHPPVQLIGAVIRKIIQEKAQGILILPFWRTMKDWLVVCSDGVHFNRVFTRGTAFWPFYRKGPQVDSNTFAGYTKFATLALEFDGRQNEPLSS
eukprot:TCALIF_13254-PA protein Name:"Protein of unknown function" AED:0.03 eAED:0.10 QI:0/0/0/1/0/0/2/0/597